MQDRVARPVTVQSVHDHEVLLVVATKLVPALLEALQLTAVLALPQRRVDAEEMGVILRGWE